MFSFRSQSLWSENPPSSFRAREKINLATSNSSARTLKTDENARIALKAKEFLNNGKMK